MARVKGLYSKKDRECEEMSFHDSQDPAAVVIADVSISAFEDGLCPTRFYANIVTEGLDMSTLTQGAFIKVGDVLLEVSDRTKKCHDECWLEKKPCGMVDLIRYAKVAEGGRVSVSDDVEGRQRE